MNHFDMQAILKPMEFAITVLIIILFFSLLAVGYLYFSRDQDEKKIHDLEIKDVSAQLELKKKVLQDEINNEPIGDVIAKRNSDRGDK